MRSSWPDAVTRMPVRMGRVSSREALRWTRVIVSTKAPAGTETTASPPASGKGGKSSARSVRMWKVAEPETISTSCSLGRCSSDTRSPGSARMTSSSRRAGRTTVPSRLTSAVETGTRKPTSMSVARSSAPAWVAWSWTPESACTAERVEATRLTVASWARSGSRGVSSFIGNHLDRKGKEKERVVIGGVEMWESRADGRRMRAKCSTYGRWTTAPVCQRRRSLRGPL